MRRQTLAWLVAATMVLGGCGGAAKPATSPGYGYGGGGAAKTAAAADAPQAESSSPADVEASEPSPPPAAPAGASAPSSAPRSAMGGDEARTEREPDPSTRPGLATQWGETRTSHVHDVSFDRADWDHPFAIASLYYNDRQGVEALASFHGDRAPRMRDVPAANGAISISIRDEGGSPLEAVRTRDRIYVIGSSGQRYSIVITNRTAHRFETVATVDGLDVLDGKAGSLDHRGYVLVPYGTLTIDGFRQSHDAVAAFRFGRVSSSYAAQTGSARNVGVIGVAFFSEAGDVFDPYSVDELHTRDTATPFPAEQRFAQPPPVR